MKKLNKNYRGECVMGLSSSLYGAESVATQIKNAGKSIYLNSVASANVTGVTAHQDCEQLYSSMEALLETYNDRIESDAGNITGIALEFEKVDQELAKEFKSK